MMSNVITIVVTNITIKPVIKKMSAIFSYLADVFSFSFLIEKNESIQLTMKAMVATAVNSSISEDCFKCKTFNEVKTRKQSPSKLDEVFKMCEDLLIKEVWNGLCYQMVIFKKLL